jgi:hypothetical protein
MIFTDGTRLAKADSFDEIADRLGEAVYRDMPIDDLADAIGERATRAIVKLMIELTTVDMQKLNAWRAIAAWRRLRPREYVKIDGRPILVSRLEEAAPYGVIARLVDGEWVRD